MSLRDDNGCTNKDFVVNALMHAAGLHHRESYASADGGNIVVSQEKNFDIPQKYRVQYDINSIMHYAIFQK